ncbi:YhcN/YlaJ family sporulation lipoprotein [Bacillus sp. 2205SS5-2]|uniref:YhcN/YlaJ family sporulation lipoprotein n=1 Tax=Bacillus sp. 2205SS5-2 TaxID=3109031 RepID=UPI003006A255
MKVCLYLITALILLTACSTSQSKENQVKDNKQPISVNDSNIKVEDREQSRKVSKHLEELAVSIPNVKSATAVALGGYAIVGIDVDKDLERSDVGSLKYSVAESLKNDPYGAEAIVVADPDITARLKELGQDIQEGHPLQGVMNELADIAGRLMPEIPKLLQTPDPEKAPEEQDKKLNNQKENELDKEQEDQSNDHLKQN